MAGSHEKILFLSIVLLLSMNIFVAPLIGESNDAELPILDPPSDVMLSEDYQSPPEPTGYLDAITRVGVIAIDFLGTGLWLVLSLGSTLFGGTFTHPLLTIVNALLATISGVTLYRLLRGN